MSRRVMRPTELVSRRAAVVQAVLALSPTFLAPAPARSLEPSKEQVLVAKRAFEAFDQRQLPLADELFTSTIDSWRQLDRGVEELTSLLVARAGVRVDRTNFAAAKEDLDEAIRLMETLESALSVLLQHRKQLHHQNEETH